jgi:hypothetical protein
VTAAHGVSGSVSHFSILAGQWFDRSSGCGGWSWTSMRRAGPRRRTAQPRMSSRAVRGFTDRHVPKEVLERVLSAAAWAVRIEPPSVARLRAGRLVVGREQEACRRAALRRSRYSALGHGGATEGRCREWGLFRRSHRPRFEDAIVTFPVARLRNSLPVPARGRWPTVGCAEGHVRQRPHADTLRQALPLCRPAESLDYAMRLHANVTHYGLVGEECIPLPEEKCSCCSESWCEPRGGPRDHDVSA